MKINDLPDEIRLPIKEAARDLHYQLIDNDSLTNHKVRELILATLLKISNLERNDK
jgi:hypothetical protein